MRHEFTSITRFLTCRHVVLILKINLVRYKSFEAFQASVKARKFEYENGKLTYESEAKETFEYWANSKQLPKINGTPVNLNPEKTYDGPFLSMKHGENKVVIKYPGHEDVVLEF